jgi:hypothetical protein
LINSVSNALLSLPRICEIKRLSVLLLFVSDSIVYLKVLSKLDIK